MLSTLRLVVVLLGGLLFFTYKGHAQSNPPAWGQAHALGARATMSGDVEIGVDASGNTYEFDTFFGTLTIGGTTLTSQGSGDIYLAKYTPTGSVAWVRQLGSTGFDLASGLALDAAGNVYITGSFTSSISIGNGLTLNGAGGSHLFVVRYSPQGIPAWAQQSAAITSQRAFGGAIGLDATGTVYVAGWNNGSLTLGGYSLTTSTAAGFLAQLAGASGQPLSLSKTYEYPSWAAYASPKLTVAADGHAYVLLSFGVPSVQFGTTLLTSRGDSDIAVAHYLPDGTLDWVQQLGGPAMESARGRVDTAGNLYVAGAFSGTATFGTLPVTSSGNQDGFLLQYAATGALQWVRTCGGVGEDGLQNIALDATGNPYVSGFFNAGALVGSSALPNVGRADILVAAYTPQGQLRWVQTAGGPGDDYGGFLGLDGIGTLHVLGRFDGTCAFGAISLRNAAPTEAFLAQLRNAPLATRPAIATALLAPYPNPASDELHLPSLPTGTRVRLIDALGRVARETTVSTKWYVSVRGLAPGLYTLHAHDANGRLTYGRVLVQ